MKNLLVFLFLLIPLILSARNQQQQQQMHLMYPFNTDTSKLRNTNPQILRDRFELNMNANFAKTVAKKRDRYKKIMNQTLDVNMLAGVSVKQLKDTNIIYLHSNFVTQVRLPIGTRILNAVPSTKFDVFQKTENLLILQPTRRFVNANIVVTFTDGSRNYYTNIIVQKYSQVVYEDKFFKKYVIDDNYLSTNYQFVNKIIYSPIDVLKKYFRLNGERSINKFRKDGDYDVILIDGVSFYITRDERFGQVDYETTRFSVTQSYTYGDKSLLGKPISSTNRYYPSKNK